MVYKNLIASLLAVTFAIQTTLTVTQTVSEQQQVLLDRVKRKKNLQEKERQKLSKKIQQEKATTNEQLEKQIEKITEKSGFLGVSTGEEAPKKMAPQTWVQDVLEPKLKQFTRTENIPFQANRTLPLKELFDTKDNTIEFDVTLTPAKKQTHIKHITEGINEFIATITKKVATADQVTKDYLKSSAFKTYQGRKEASHHEADWPKLLFKKIREAHTFLLDNGQNSVDDKLVDFSKKYFNYDPNA